MMKTIAVPKSSLDGGFQESKLNIIEQPPICYSISSKQHNQETTFSSPYLSNSQKIPVRQINLQNCKTDENEISIFDAQKYFNEGSEQLPNHTIKSSPVSKPMQYNLAEFPRYSSMSSSSVETYNARNYGTRSFYATPTASSEASWNSQTGLLSNPPGTIKVSLHNLTPIAHEKRKTNSPRWFFRRNSPCIGKKSTQVDHKTVTSEAQSRIHFRSITQTNLSKQHSNNNNIPKEKSPEYKTTTRLSTEKDRDQQPIRISITEARNFNNGATGFSFPILNPSTKILEEPPRDSLDVFHPSNHENPIPKTTTEKLIDDDAASDGSSDLFELESFSIQATTYQMYKNNNNNYRRESSEETANFRNPIKLSVITRTATNDGLYRRNSLEEPATPSAAPTEGYEPSEASIDWSVTTADGFDRASVATYDDLNDRDGGVGGGRRNGGSGLLGFSCRSEKAVLVGSSPQRVRPGMIKSIPVAQHSGNWANNKPSLASRPNQLQR